MLIHKDATLDQAALMLHHIDPTERETWLRCGMAMHHEFGEAGFANWDQWSQQASNYNREDAKITWRSFKNGGGITFATIVKLAKDNGFDYLNNDIQHKSIIIESANDNFKTIDTKKNTHIEHSAKLYYDICSRVNILEHPYIVKKNIANTSLLKIGKWILHNNVYNDCLIVPLYNEHFYLQSLQAICGNKLIHGKEKVFFAGASITGCFLPIGPEIHSASTILIGEGLATVDAAVKATGFPGIVAFTASNLTNVSIVIRKLAGPNVTIVILADDDQKPGMKTNPGLTAATKAATAVHGIIACPNMAKKADFWDVLNELGEKAVQDRIMQATSLSSQSKHFVLKRRQDILNSPDLKWVVKGVLPDRGIACIYGASGSAKSFLTIDLATCIALGNPWFSRKTTKTSIYYICLEGQAGLKQRVQAWEIHNNRVLPNNFNVITDSFNIRNIDHINELSKLIDNNSICIIDTLSKASAGADENSSKDMGIILENAAILQQRIEGLVIFVAHTGKKAELGIRGHSSLPANIDTSILVSRTKDIRSWMSSKEKDAKDGEQDYFELKVIEIGYDEDGDLISSCVINPKDKVQANAALNETLSGETQLGWTTFLQTASSTGQLDDQGKFVGLLTEVWRQVFYSKSSAPNLNAKKKAFQRIRSKLIEAGFIQEVGGYYRLAGESALIKEAEITNALRSMRHGYKIGTLPVHVPTNNCQPRTVLVPPSLEGVPSTAQDDEFPTEFIPF